MTFYEWKCVDPELFFLVQNKKICESNLYDKRFRCSQIERKALWGIIDPNPLSYLPPSTPVICADGTKVLEIIYNLYFNIEPNHILMTNKTICDQRRESFDEWLESRFLFTGISGKIFANNSVEFTPLKSTKDSENSLQILSDSFHLSSSFHESYLKEFLSIACYESKLISSIPLPMVLGREECTFITQQWLLVISWWKKVALRLRPLTIKFRDTYNAAVASEAKRSSSTRFVKAEKILRKLKRILKDCRNQQMELFLDKDMESGKHGYGLPHSFFETANIEVEDSYEDILFTTQRVIKHKELVEELIVFSTKVTSETIVYLLNIQKGQNGHDEFDKDLKNSVAQEFRVLNGKVRSSHRRKSRITTGDFQEIVEGLLVSIGNCLRLIKERVAEENALKSDEKEQFGRALQNGHELLEMLMEACDFVALEHLYSHYDMKVQKDFMSTLLRQYHRQMIQSCIRSIAAKRTLQPVNAADRRDRLQVVSQHFYESVISTVQRILEDCVPVVKPTSSHMAIDLPRSIINEDFPRYLKEFPMLFCLCPHPLEDIDALTECRLLRLKADILTAFEKNVNNIMELFRMAEECVSLSEIVAPAELDLESILLQEQGRQGSR